MGNNRLISCNHMETLEVSVSRIVLRKKERKRENQILAMIQRLKNHGVGRSGLDSGLGRDWERR